MYRHFLTFCMTASCLLGCAEILRVPSTSEFHSPEDYNGRVQALVQGSSKDEARAYWLAQVRVLEGLAAQTDPELPLACLGSTRNGSFVVDGSAPAEMFFDQDLRFYDLIARSHEHLVAHTAEMIALMQVADRDFAHKDEFKELALRGIVAFERLLDHHRYLLAQAKSSGCLADDVVYKFKFTAPARAAYLDLLKGVKVSTELVGDLAGLTNVAFHKYADPLSQRRAFAARIARMAFLHKIYAESSAEAEDGCVKLLAAQPMPPPLGYMCGYLFERLGRDRDAQRYYERLKTLSSDSLEFLAKAKKRIAYMEEWNRPLGAQSQYQVRIIPQQ